jgi:signal peptidase II
MALALVAADQGTKALVAASWPLGSEFTVIPGFFHLVHMRNTGAAWGMLPNQTGLLAVFSLVVATILLWRFDYLVETWAERAIALALVLSGIVGNLIDRVFRGEVVDFILLFYRSFHWPAFNVADSAITCGVAVFVISSFIRPPDEHGA